MDCNEARPLFGAACDRELSVRDAAALEHHLSGCAACRVELARIAALHREVGAALRRPGVYARAPAALRVRLEERLGVVPQHARGLAADKARIKLRMLRNGWAWLRNAIRDTVRPAGLAAPSRPGWRPGGAWPLSAMATVAGTGVVALGALVTSLVLITTRPSSDTVRVDEIVASHVRGLLADRSIDVVSSDQHTVKPWFNGKLDYAPPVHELSATGFPLAGGRLDYVGGRPVAVLVYHYRRHPLDVYVLPLRDGSVRASEERAPAGEHAAPILQTRQGYTLLHWRDADFDYWAVTDADAGALTAFHRAWESSEQTRTAQPRPAGGT
jgi:anti-sigma factor RsiW